MNQARADRARVGVVRMRLRLRSIDDVQHRHATMLFDARPVPVPEIAQSGRRQRLRQGIAAKPWMTPRAGITPHICDSLDTVALQQGELPPCTSLSHSTIYRRMALGTFPRSYKTGGRAVWFKEDIDHFIASIKDEQNVGESMGRAA